MVGLGRRGLRCKILGRIGAGSRLFPPRRSAVAAYWSGHRADLRSARPAWLSVYRRKTAPASWATEASSTIGARSSRENRSSTRESGAPSC